MQEKNLGVYELVHNQLDSTGTTLSVGLQIWLALGAHLHLQSSSLQHLTITIKYPLHLIYLSLQSPNFFFAFLIA